MVFVRACKGDEVGLPGFMSKRRTPGTKQERIQAQLGWVWRFARQRDLAKLRNPGRLNAWMQFTRRAANDVGELLASLSLVRRIGQQMAHVVRLSGVIANQLEQTKALVHGVKQRPHLRLRQAFRLGQAESQLL